MERSITTEIANAAARLAVQEGLRWDIAKRRALGLLGLPARTALPNNRQMEDAVRDYIALFHADTQPLQALRELALVWMERLHTFRPHLEGAVWHGTATRLSDIELALFCDDPKSAEIALIDHQLPYTLYRVTGWRGKPVEVLSLHSYCSALNCNVNVHLLIYDLDDLRGGLRADARGRAPRGAIGAVRQLVQVVPSL